MSPNRSQLRVAGQTVALVALFTLGLFLGHKAPSQQSLLTAPGTSPARVAAIGPGVPGPATSPAAGRLDPISLRLQPADFHPSHHPAYRLVDLGRFGPAGDPIAINDSGLVIGARQNGGGQESFLWRKGRMRRIEGFWASDINDHGEIAGYSESNAGVERPVVWTRSRMTMLAIPPGASSIYAYRINNHGVVIENSIGNVGQVSRAFVCAGGHIWPLWNLPGYPGSQANAISDTGVIVGQAQTAAGPPHACLWRDGRMVDLGTLPGSGMSIAEGVNSRREVVGTASVGPGSSDLLHAVLWRHGHIRDLGSLAGWSKSGATAINDRGQVIGNLGRASAIGYGGESHPFLWQRGRMVDLNSLIPADSGWVLTDAVGINDRGEILGTGIDAGRHRTYLLVPATRNTPSLLLARRPNPPAPQAVARVSKPSSFAHRVVVAGNPPPHKRRVVVRVAAYQRILPAQPVRRSHRLQPPPIPIAYQGTVVSRGPKPYTYQVQQGTVSRNVYFGPNVSVRSGEQIQVRGVLDRDGTVAAGSVARLGKHRARQVTAGSQTRPMAYRDGRDYEIITWPAKRSRGGR